MPDTLLVSSRILYPASCMFFSHFHTDAVRPELFISNPCIWSYRAGDKKISTDPFSEQTEEQKAVQKEVMDSLHNTFISFVKERRGDALAGPEKDDVFSGRVWTGSDAVKIGLVDHVGTLHEVCCLRFQEGVALSLTVL
jgi:hypothetical protein